MSAPTVDELVTPPAGSDRSTLLRRAPVLLGLAGLAVAQPQLDLFGRNPEFFIASDYTRFQIVAFALVVTFAVPLVAVGVVALVHVVAGTRAAEATHQAFMAVFAFAFALVAARHLDWESVPVVAVFAATVAATVVILARRFAGFELLLRYLAFAPVLFVALFLFASRSADLLWEGEAGAEVGVTVGRPAPIVWVMLDEVPLASLVTVDGDIDEQRFPGFARLAATSTWYRDATAVSGGTNFSVPSTLTGLVPSQGSAPTSLDHPRNLFTLLGTHADMQVIETVTDMCPDEVCSGAGVGVNRRGNLDQIRRGITDAAVVYGHQTLPETYRSRLAAIDQSFGGFLDDDAGGDASELAAEEAEADTAAPTGEILRAAIEGIDLSSPDPLFYVHEVFPHFNWVRTPTGELYDGPRGPPGSADRVWLDDEFLIRQALQRHLLQLGYADTLLGHLLDQLQASDRWEETLVVVTADHGIAFIAGQHRRHVSPANVQELLRVPLFIKAPGQTSGAVDDGNARLIDILPTVIDLLDIDVDWELDGVSLVADGPRPTAKPTMTLGPDGVPGGVDEVLAVAERNARWIPAGGWQEVVQVGRYGSLVGRDIADLETDGDADLRWKLSGPETLSDYDPAVDLLPLIVTGTLEPREAGPPEEALIVLNGRVAGVVGFPTVGRSWRFTALIDPTALVPGANDVAIYVPEGPPADPVLRPAVPSS